jgi:hypothetical protein
MGNTQYIPGTSIRALDLSFIRALDILVIVYRARATRTHARTHTHAHRRRRANGWLRAFALPSSLDPGAQQLHVPRREPYRSYVDS